MGSIKAEQENSGYDTRNATKNASLFTHSCATLLLTLYRGIYIMTRPRKASLFHKDTDIGCTTTLLEQTSGRIWDLVMLGPE